jgi:hypothetical protein
MKKVVLVLMIALFGGTMDVVANTTNATEQCDNNKRRRKKFKKRKYRRSSQHVWQSVNIGRTCNKRR